MEKSILELENISFSYGKNEIIRDFSLSVGRGEFITLLGPSGCGKTTVLRLIAGFLFPSNGDIKISGKSVVNLPVDKRKIGFVFQDYALFPHMTVRQNLLFGFSRRQQKHHEYDLQDISETLGLTNLLDRYPHELSGGQQQRVALGRTLILKPEIILMDEPLSSLDAALRRRLRDELLELQKKIGITTIYVTHDQEEALSLSSRIAVMEKGKLLQFDSPQNVYFHPAGKDAAMLTGPVSFLKISDGIDSLEEKTVMIRPEWVDISDCRKSPEDLKATVVSTAFLGNSVRYKLSLSDCENSTVIADSSQENIIPACSTVYLHLCKFEQV